MKIYYVSENCQAKGPAFLRLANNDYLEEGDICIVNAENGAVAYLLTANQQTWKHCKVIDSVEKLKVDWSNFLIYSYDGLNKRKGDIGALKKLISCFKKSILSKLFKDLIEIIEYRKDLVDASLLHKIYKKTLSSESLSDVCDKNPIESTTGASSQSRSFVSYLSEKEIEVVHSLIAKGLTEKEVIASFRTSYPTAFRNAFLEFNQNNPNGSIYDGLLEFCEKESKQKLINAQIPTKVETTVSTIDNKIDYIEIFQHLHVNMKGNTISPHKPVLLLTIADLIEQGIILSPFIPISEELKKHFKVVWEKYVPEGNGHSCAMHYPFYYMKSECFWTLAPIPNYVKKSAYSLNELRKNFYGAIIDKELFEAFSDEKKRSALKEVLITKYIVMSNSVSYQKIDEKQELVAEQEKKYRELKDIPASKVSEESKSESCILGKKDTMTVEIFSRSSTGISEEELNLSTDLKIDKEFNYSNLDFKRFLNCIKASDNNLSNIKIVDFYVASLESSYMYKILRHYHPSGSIYEIRDKQMLKKLLEDIKFDLGLSSTNEAYCDAVKLYMRFFNLVSTRQLKFDNLNNKKIGSFKLPYGAQVKKITSRDFTILSTGNSNKLLYDFVVAVGAEKVYDLRIPLLGGYLLDKTRNLTYISNCKYIVGGYWLNVTGSLSKKVDLIQLIAEKLKINIYIELTK